LNRAAMIPSDAQWFKIDFQNESRFAAVPYLMRRKVVGNQGFILVVLLSEE
tara:strand:+ start:155 stop:307 length:153 start_codon:yes stop_codon:yes gene_type:complete